MAVPFQQVSMNLRNSRRQLVRTLQEQISSQERAWATDHPRFISTGSMSLDHLLPGGGLQRGTLVEWLASSSGSGASLLAISATREICGNERPLVVIDRRDQFYPLPAVALGIQTQQMVILRPETARDASWALDQAMRCPAVGAVVAWPKKLDGRAYRRLQLAVETSGGIGCLVRPAAAQGQPSWADIRLLVSPRPSTRGEWRVRVELLHCRGSRQGGVAEVILDEPIGWNDETHPVPVASQLANPTNHGRAAGA